MIFRESKKFIAAASLLLFLVACAGRPANPVQVDQVGDSRRSCAAIETEMKGIQTEIARLVPETDKTGKNVGLGIAGAFLIVPLFFMDLTESEKIEVNAYRQRYNRLSIISTEKKCTFADAIIEGDSMVATTKETDSNFAQKIEQLNELQKKGLITQTEFETKRKEILDSM